ncbi:MAG: Panacea domain-containing protein [Burkholderiales bacterium]
MGATIGRNAYNPELRKDKLEQAILFFLRDANNAHLGKTKLMKLLYFADFDHFEQYDEPITGARYRKLGHGPVPDDAWRVIDEMEQSRRITRHDIISGGYTQHRYEPNEDVDVSAFSSTELAVLFQVAQKWLFHTTTQIEAATHGEAPWIAVKRNEIIPYYLAYYRNNFGAMGLEEDETPEGVPDEDEVFAG